MIKSRIQGEKPVNTGPSMIFLYLLPMLRVCNPQFAFIPLVLSGLKKILPLCSVFKKLSYIGSNSQLRET
jgi:hypothetical protein